ncbi:NIPSNAP family protein [Fibrivirga algicola]|uniref:NIPSNAP family protein n=1 Tax=Fibrivirga algicola TaxID=2950420 RepID=A0ABX0QFV6_9BACT|nr:NIPSNAP family protein [Fibrivirga algicola]ARK12110.1 NIPSNAP family containing protein [Fibrella sp. ES10-3-2-2]NID11056.1 NIPSNAP family protein [Fibrivirga algicola]
MKKLRFTLFFASSLAALCCINSAALGQSSKYYEVRVYHPTPGKYAAIVDRFRQYTTKLFEKHGMENIGYWTPTDTSRQELVYILAYPSKAARDTSWKHFGADPAWREVVAKTEANGKLVSKVDSYFMTESDLSPAIKLKKKSPMRTFELRTYTAQPDKLPNLLSRFRDHTRKLFTKHGMENIAYWVTAEKEGVQPKLVYILAHPSEAEGKANFDLFRKDPKWEKVKAESEKDGPLTVKVESLYMKPTDYSPLQ